MLQRAFEIAQAQGTVKSSAVADMMWLGFFYLGRPGEYTEKSEDSTPFRACDATLFMGEQPISYVTASTAFINVADFLTLEFTTQKNAVRGEVVGHGATPDPKACPVAAAKRRLLHLLEHEAPPETTLCSYFYKNRWHEVKSSDITKLLRQAAAELPQYNLRPSDISARSLRAAGAMALLCDMVDSDRIRLLGRWRSDEMLRYLHLQARPVMQDFATRMLSGGDYSLLPSAPGQLLTADTCEVPVA